MHDIIDKTPRLFRITNTDTMEVFTVFALNKESAISTLPVGVYDPLIIEEVMVDAGDGSLHNVFQLRQIKASASGTYFRTVNCNTLKAGKTVWIKCNGNYYPSTRKYCCCSANDISKSREFKPGQWVITTFTF